jgi:photosystem II stability/assembly factor-like uncharacterized protein
MFFLNKDTGFVCGVAGKMFKTTNGGVSWNALTSGAVVDLYDIEFVSPTTGFAVGLNGTIRKTTNGGLSWTSVSSGTSTNLLAIDMVTASQGFIVGSNGLILRTLNGSSWSQQTSNVISSLNDVRTLDGTNVFACGIDCRFLFSDDGGSTWQATYLDSTYSDLYALDFIDNDTGWIAGQYGKIFSTVDGGNSWTLEAAVTGSLLLDLQSPSSCQIFAAGTGGTVVKKECNTLGTGAPLDYVSLLIYPNPAINEVHVIADKPIERISSLFLSDPSGRTYRTSVTEMSSCSMMIDVRDLPRGLYFLNLPGRPSKRYTILLQ